MITNFIQSLPKKELSPEVMKRQFLPGQIFHGKVMKLFPNQIAEVLVGNQKLIANLEVPLSAGERYWFQVLSGEGKIHLKVLPGDDKGNSNHASFVNLLNQMNLPATKENLELLNFFIKEQLAVSKENLQSVRNLMKDSTLNKEDFEVVKEMILRNLPMTKEVFSSISTKGEPLHKLLQNLQAQLESHSLNESSKALSSLLNDLTLPGQDKANERVVTQLLKNMLNPEMDNDSVISGNILQKLGLINDRNLQHAAVRLIMGSNGIPTINETDLTSLRQALQVGEVEKIESVVKNIFREAFTNLEGKLEQEIVLARNFLSLVSADGKKQENQRFDSFSTNSMNEQEINVVNKVIQKIQNEETSKWENGKFVADHLKNLVGKLGIDYESVVLQLLKEGKDINVQKLDVLKAALIQILNEEPTPQLKELSEQVLNKITGMQLLSQDAGPTQQYVMQIPLSFWKQTSDLTIQWNGRKKENGQIDPNYCRVLFYLDLEFLNEVIVDMQIQNRIMNIKVISDVEEVKQMATPYMEDLKANLDSLGFKLSNIVFQSTNEKESQLPKKVSGTYFQSSQYNGVDIKI